MLKDGHVFPLVDHVIRRELAMTLEHGDDLDALSPDTVDKPITSLNDFAQAGSWKFGNHSAHLGKLR